MPGKMYSAHTEYFQCVTMSLEDIVVALFNSPYIFLIPSQMYTKTVILQVSLSDLVSV